MKFRITYNIIINNIIYETSTNYNRIVDLFKEVRKSEPTAWIQTCYC